MNFVVWPLPRVTARLAREPRSIQDQFQQIAGVLATNPYPNPGFPLVTEEQVPGEPTIYTFAAPRFPFVFQYLIFPEMEDYDGFVVIIAIFEDNR